VNGIEYNRIEFAFSRIAQLYLKDNQLEFMMASPTKFALLCGLLAMFCFGVYDVLKNYEDNACEMTYMFEMPEYMVSKADDRRTIKSASHVGMGNYRGASWVVVNCEDDVRVFSARYWIISEAENAR